ncbi:MAG: hypothetical protein ACO2ZM_07820 [Francisellaceae bacterium]
MTDYINAGFATLYMNASIIIVLLSAIVHILCALGISKDLGHFARRNITPQLMPAFAWIIAVLITGIWGFFIYWIMHHSSLSRK